MKKKKAGEMTFKEFFDLAEDEQARQYIWMSLKKEGFSEKQLNEMKMERVWKLFFDSQIPFFDQLFATYARVLEENPQLALQFSPILEKIRKSLEKQIKELEEEEKRRRETSES